MQYSGVTHDFQSFPMTLQNAKFRACQIAFESLFSNKEIAVLSAGFAPRIAAHCGAEIDQTHKLQLKSKFVHAIKFQLSCPVGRALLELPHPLPKIVLLHFFFAPAPVLKNGSTFTVTSNSGGAGLLGEVKPANERN